MMGTVKANRLKQPGMFLVILQNKIEGVNYGK
jgi:hypothetical protein